MRWLTPHESRITWPFTLARGAPNALPPRALRDAPQSAAHPPPARVATPPSASLSFQRACATTFIALTCLIGIVLAAPPSPRAGVAPCERVLALRSHPPRRLSARYGNEMTNSVQSTRILASLHSSATGGVYNRRNGCRGGAPEWPRAPES